MERLLGPRIIPGRQRPLWICFAFLARSAGKQFRPHTAYLTYFYVYWTSHALASILTLVVLFTIVRLAIKGFTICIALLIWIAYFAMSKSSPDDLALSATPSLPS